MVGWDGMRQLGKAGGVQTRPSLNMGDASSTSKLLHGLPFGGGVIRETRKAEKGNRRFIVLYDGKIKHSSKKQLAGLARDRAFDLAHQRFNAAPKEDQRSMLARSIKFQRRARKSGIARLQGLLATTTRKREQAKIQGDLSTLTALRPHSPHLGHKPVSAYLRRYQK